MDEHYVGILIKAPDMRRAEWLTPRGTLTTKRLHAGMAERIVAEATAERLRADNPDCIVTVRRAVP